VSAALLVVLLAAAVPGTDAPADPLAGWDAVLARHVDAQGRVDFEGLRRAPAPLAAVVAGIARVSPKSHPERFPTKDAAKAYWLNAYNALAMYGAASGRSEPESKLRFFYLTKYTLGGERMSLYALEKDIVRKLGDARVHFALNCMVRSCPRLPREPFSAARLEAQLDAAAREFRGSARHVQVEAQERVVRVSKILDWYEDDFLAEAPSLLAYVNRFRTHKVPEDFEVEHLPYDWTVNDWNRPPAPAR
jgi:Protein of unknown function, DUF547